MDQSETIPTSTPAENPVSPWNGKDVLLITLGALVIFILGFVAISVGMRALNLSGQPSLFVSAASGALEGIALIGSLYLFGLRRKGLGWQAVGLRSPLPGWWIAGLLIGLIVIPISGLIALAIQLLLGRPLENPQLPFLAPEGFTWIAMISMLVLGGLVAPLAEEMFFRGLLYDWMHSRWGTVVGILGSALIFGAVHGEVSVGGAAAVLGIVLAWVYQRSHSLWPSFLIHALNNSVKIVLLYAMIKGGALNLPF
jgi:uncharacterized protein